MVKVVKMAMPKLIEGGTLWTKDGVLWDVAFKDNPLDSAIEEIKKLRKRNNNLRLSRVED